MKSIQISARKASRTGSITIAKARVNQDDRKTALINLKASILKELNGEAKVLESKLSVQDRLYAPLHNTIIADRAALTAAKDLYQATMDKQAGISELALGPFKTLDLKVSLGSKIIVPPYDAEWHTFFATASKATGKFGVGTFNDSDAAAVGMRLTASQPVMLRLTTLAFIRYAWACSPISAAAASAGGIGIIGYRDNEKSPFDTERATLWSYTSGSAPKNDSGSTSFGQTLQRSFFVPMEPGHSYLIWLWCWAIGRSTVEGSRFGFATSDIRCDAPLILLEAQPPPYHPPLH